MLPLVLDSVLLFAFSIPVVMKYRILPVIGTPYALFGLLFLVLLLHCLISIYPEILGKNRRHLDSIKSFFLIFTLVITIGGVMVTSMVDRAKTAPVFGVHDIILQQEAAMRKLIEGKNPYKETYFDTPLASFNYDEPGNTEAVNPALYHFVMPPWYLMFPFAFYFTAIPLFGFFDGRMALLFTMVFLLICIWYWFRDKALARIAIVLTALSPSVVDYFIEGRSDVFALSWLIGGVVLLGRKKFMWSGVLVALSLLSKQTTWFVIPFYGLYLWKQTVRTPVIFWRTIAASLVVVVIFVAPFLVWDAHAFFDSVVFYLTGNTLQSYPVSGYGLGMTLYEFGVIRDIHAYYPFVIWQLLLGGPLLVVLFRWLSAKPTESRLIISYATFLAVYWYLSRYFNNSHLGYISMLFFLGGLKQVDEANT
ncbi:MAG TPA: glycosyltransferase 87 family protein [Patescibacteria group bacterium]|nr:glycosyltransferase 87 family protein [Patescibacteria group bacterium]